MTNLGNDDYIDLAGAKEDWAIMMLDRKVGVGSNGTGPSERYRFYHGAKGEPPKGRGMIRCAL